MTEREGMFRGKERSTLFLLAAIMVGGWLVVLWSFVLQPAAPPRRDPPAAARVAPVMEPDQSIEFQGLQDKRPFNMRENPAYRILVERARKNSSAELSAVSRRDVIFSQVIDAPKLYRGIPIHVEGIARRILVQDVKGSTVFPKGRYYEAYTFSTDSLVNPWILVFEDPPAHLSAGDNLQERIAFDGYFFKLVSYEAADMFRFAPVLVGRVAPPPPVEAPQSIPWTVVVVGVLTLVCAIRIVLMLSRVTARRTSYAPTLERPTDQIAPEALGAWLRGDPPPPDKDSLEDEFP